MVQVMACCLTAPSHSRTNVDLSSIKYIGNHLRLILQELLKTYNVDMNLKITNLILQPHLPWDNDVMRHWDFVSDIHVPVRGQSPQVIRA